MTEFTYHNKLVGSTFRDDAQEIIKSFVLEGDILHLEAEPNNKYDNNAVAVYFGEEMIGYLPKENAAKIQGDVLQGNVICVVSEVTGQSQSNVGCNVEITVVRDDEVKA